MNRTEFIIVTALILFVAFALGWFSYWLLHRFKRVKPQDMSELDRMAQALHEAEEIRDQAIAYVEGRERELTRKLAQTEAELHAAMDGLRAARADADYLRSYIESMQASQGQESR